MQKETRRANYRFVYVAVVDGQAKIGATADPAKRYRGSQIVKAWEHAAPADIEALCTDMWSHRLSRCREFYDATSDEAMAHVEHVFSLYEAGERPFSNALRARMKKAKSVQRLMDQGLSFWEAVKRFRPDL